MIYSELQYVFDNYLIFNKSDLVKLAINENNVIEFVVFNKEVLSILYIFEQPWMFNLYCFEILSITLHF